ncbi:hypothetical protein AQJ23_17100 [Streptomyces antibioticus]|nr:hypothetical protein AQJ23_17100 [Streptomyces antibioticus]
MQSFLSGTRGWIPVARHRSSASDRTREVAATPHSLLKRGRAAAVFRPENEKPYPLGSWTSALDRFLSNVPQRLRSWPESA